MNTHTSVRSSQRRTGTTLRPALQALRQQHGGAAGAALADLGPGSSLPDEVRAPLEQRLGQDFSRVRVHTGQHADAIAGAFGAKALADGDELVFAPGHFAPATARGRELLAHELSHVVQQRQGGGGAAPAEARAQSAAGVVAQGGSVTPHSLGGADPGVHCDPEDKNKASVLPPMPNFQLSTLPPLDYMKLQGIAGAHAQRFSMRDSDDMAAEWKRRGSVLQQFGLSPDSSIGTKILKLGLERSYLDRLASDSPNQEDKFNRDVEMSLKQQGGWQTPIFTVDGEQLMWLWQHRPDFMKSK